MILINKIEYWEVDRDPVEILSHHSTLADIPLPNQDGEIEGVEIAVISEFVHGRRFTNPFSREEIVIGCSKQAADLLGMQYEAWDALISERVVYQKAAIRYERELEKSEAKHTEYRRANLWHRIKWAFITPREKL